MSIPEIDIDAFDMAEHAMIACARACMDHFAIVTKISFRIDRSDGDWQETRIGDTTREPKEETA